MTATPEPQDVAAEHAVLGAAMVLGTIKPAAEVGLRSSHFWKPSHVKVYEAMSRLHVHAAGIDPISVASEMGAELAELPQGKARLEELESLVPAAGNIAHYARLVRDACLWRRRYRAGLAIRDAALTLDAVGYKTAMQRLIGLEVGR